MGDHGRALISLCECLRGELPAHVDWISVVGLANETLTTPELIDLVIRFERDVPPDVCAYVRHIHQRNLERNDRLMMQLEEAVAAINGRGVTPVLLKGAATLAQTPRVRRGRRLMADLDIVVAPEQAEPALAALASVGYELHFQTPADGEKWFVELKRSHDVGMIDLHQGAPGPAYFYRPPGRLLDHCRRVPVGCGSAYVPTATYQAFVLIIHDQFQDFDYWVGKIDVRHLVHLRDLTESPDGIDWEELAAFAASRLAKNAVESQLVALAELLGGKVPPSMRTRLVPRLQFWRRTIQARFPIMRWPLLITTVLDYGNYRRGLGAEYRAPCRRFGQPWPMPKAGTLRFILGLANDDRVGKV